MSKQHSRATGRSWRHQSTTEGRTQTLRRHSAPVAPPRIRNEADDERYEEEALDNSTTDDEDGHTDRETSRCKLRCCAGRERMRGCHRRGQTPRLLERTRGRLSTTTKTPTSTMNAATTQTATPASTKIQKTIQKTRSKSGSTTKKREKNQKSSSTSRQDSSWYDDMPKEETFLIPLQYVDVTKTTDTTLDVMSEKHIEDYWNVDGEKELSNAWTGFTRFILLNERPPDGYTWSGERLTREQNTSRPDNVWPDMWTRMSDAAKKKAKQRWAIEKPKLDNDN